MILRSRVVGLLAQRFRRRIVELRADAGFGKTVAIRQAVDENLLVGAGVDVTVSASEHRGDERAVVAELLQRLDPDAPGEHVVEHTERLIESVLSRSPTDVCLVIDDAHSVRDPALLADLVDHLPRNGHLCLSTRRALDLPTTRLRAAGEHVVITDADLAFDADELGEFATASGVSVDLLSGSAGWPALAALTAHGGSRLATRFVHEQVLGDTDADTVDALRVWAAIGRCEADLLEAALPDHDVERLMASVPLVDRDVDGWKLHDLWTRALDIDESAPRIRERVLAAAEQLAEIDPGRACALWVDFDAWDRLVDHFRNCALGYREPPPVDELERLLAALPPEVRAVPAAEMMAGVVALRTAPDTSISIWERAADGFATGGDLRGETSAWLTLARLCEEHEVPSTLDRGRRRLADLASSGEQRAQEVRDIVETIGLRMERRFDEALALLDELERRSPSPEALSLIPWLRGTLLLRLGRPGEAADAARAATKSGVDSITSLALGTLGWALWLDGDTHATLSLIDPTIDLLARQADPSWVQTGYLYFATGLLMHGEREKGEALLERARPIPLVDVTNRAAIGTADAVLSLLEGDELRARQHLLNVVDAAMSTDYQIRLSALWYVLVPEHRPALSDLPGCYATAIGLAEAIVAARHGDLEPAASLAVPDEQIVVAHLPAPWIAELSVALAAAGRPEHARRLADDTVPAVRDAIDRRLRADGADVPHELAVRLAPRPPHRWRLLVFGPTELTCDGRPTEHDAWRRTRVRELLLFLVEHPRPTRTEVWSQLWPDKSEASARRNLEVTLSYLTDLIDGDRPPDTSPFFVTTTRDRLELTRGPDFRIDLDDWDEIRREISRYESRSTPSAALPHYARLLDLRRGAAFQLRAVPEWAEAPRRRLDVQFVAAATRYADLLHACGDHETAAETAVRAIEVDRWSEPAHQAHIRARSALDDPIAAAAASAAWNAALEELERND
ncbi:MAG: AAA family ATPase [Actinomycetota bacterium]